MIKDDEEGRRAVETARRVQRPEERDSTALLGEDGKRAAREYDEGIAASAYTIDVAAVSSQRDGEALRAELERLYPEPPGGWPPKPPDYPDPSDRHAVSAFIRKRLMKKRVNNFCELCGSQCVVLQTERVAADIAKLRDVVDYVLTQDPHAGIYVRRGRDHELTMLVECEDLELVEKIVRSAECHQGIELTARARNRSRDK